MTARRRVRRLRLTADDQAGLVRARHLVEDAFRTASLPLGRPGSLVVVRQLDLGVIDLSRAPQALALQLTEAVRHLVSGAVHASHPSASEAPVVWFVDAPEARAELAIRLVRGPAPDEWFWRAALPDVIDAPDASRAVALLLDPPPPVRATDTPAVVQAARIVQVLVDRGAAEAVLRHMPASAAWSRAFRATWGPPPRMLPIALPAPPSSPVAADWRPLLRRALQQWTETDVRTVWLATLAVVASRPELVASPDTPRLALRALAAARPAAPLVQAPARPEVAPTPRPATPPPDAAAALALPEVEPPQIVLRRPHQAHIAAEAPSQPASRKGPEPAPAERTPPAAARSERPPTWLDPSELDLRAVGLGMPPPLESPASTGFGGLLFLVRALYLLGMWEVVEAEPALLDQAFGYRVFDALLARLGASDDEPMRRALVPHAEPQPLGDEDFVAPARWWAELCPEPQLFEHGGPHGLRLIRALAPGLWLAREHTPSQALAAALEGRALAAGPPVDQSTAWLARRDGWVAALERWSRMVLGAEVRDIVQRPAIVAATRTHVDVVLPRSAIDMRARGRALDADPGWVPWLGRIVMFHYVEDDDFHPPEEP